MVKRSIFIIHNGFNTPFWEAKWLEGPSLKEEFLKLYKNSNLKGVLVAGMGGWYEGEWLWGNFGLKLGGNHLAADLVKLKDRLEAFQGWKQGKDVVVWTDNVRIKFSVSSCYELYGKIHSPFGPPNKYDEAFRILWKMEVLYKIKIFGWRLFLDKLPTKDGLVYRGMSFSLDNLKFTLYGIEFENRDHFFFSYLMVKKFWGEVAFWVGKRVSLENECLPNFMEWYSFFRIHKIKDCILGVVWLVTTLSLWLHRNDVCFQNEAWSINNTVCNIKFLVWK
ncbi:uncharacterized protein LOC131660769 [Vicia villosa]|uniref:uncharacterized protein LOC131660769 n=1 Tax=Vicia villosa TaxID=3911 RepID=UPI00273A916B|nr:uncharacterized protein LOC131660769 [Vicia villosa]